MRRASEGRTSVVSPTIRTYFLPRYGFKHHQAVIDMPYSYSAQCSGKVRLKHSTKGAPSLRRWLPLTPVKQSIADRLNKKRESGNNGSCYAALSSIYTTQSSGDNRINTSNHHKTGDMQVLALIIGLLTTVTLAAPLGPVCPAYPKTATPPTT
jgi:hypothetical protein